MPHTKTIGEATYSIYAGENNKDTYVLIRGPLDKTDKHWGMRSNLNFRKEIEKR